MKKIVNIFFLSLLFTCFYSCEIDNYAAPDATIQGQVYDNDGNALETGQGKVNMFIRINEISYAHGDSNITVLNQDLNMMQDGSFENTKLFKGTYLVWPFQGCFYPVDKADYQTIELKSGKTTKVQFTVIPYLTLEWVKEPYQDTDGFIKATFKFRRNAKDGVAMPNLVSAKLFVSNSIKCGDNADGRYTDNDVAITNTQEGQEIALKSKDKIWYTQKLWLRIGAKCNDADQKYCFTSIKTVDANGFGAPN